MLFLSKNFDVFIKKLNANLRKGQVSRCEGNK